MLGLGGTIWYIGSFALICCLFHLSLGIIDLIIHAQEIEMTLFCTLYCVGCSLRAKLKERGYWLSLKSEVSKTIGMQVSGHEIVCPDRGNRLHSDKTGQESVWHVQIKSLFIPVIKGHTC